MERLRRIDIYDQKKVLSDESRWKKQPHWPSEMQTKASINDIVNELTEKIVTEVREENANKRGQVQSVRAECSNMKEELLNKTNNWSNW